MHQSDRAVARRRRPDARSVAILADLHTDAERGLRASRPALRECRAFLQKAIQARDLDPYALAALIGKAPSTIYRVLKATNAKIASVAEIAHALGYTMHVSFTEAHD